MTDQIILGVKKEEDPSEDRVSIVPRDLKSLSSLGLKIVVEKDAGIKAGYSNENYEKSGASVVDSLPNNTSIVTSLNAFYDHTSNHIENSIIISLTDIRTNSEIKKIV